MNGQHPNLQSAPTDAAAREEALDPRRSFIVQAPAGSGKTGLLVQRYLTLLSRAHKPEEILAITFTRKAAGEMRQRIVQALQGTGRDPVPDDPHARKMADLAACAMQRNTSMGWSLEQNPSRLRIQTIDSLCAALVEQMPLLSRLGAGTAVSVHPRALYREAAEATVAELETGSGWSASVENLISYLDNNLERVVELVAGMLAGREQWLRHLADKDDVRLQQGVLENSLARVVQEGLEKARSALKTRDWQRILDLARCAGANLQAAGYEGRLSALISLEDLPGIDPEELETWLGLSEFMLTAAGTWRKQANKNLGFPAPSSTKDKDLQESYRTRKQDFANLLQELSADPVLQRRLHELRSLPETRYTPAQWSILQSLFEILPLAVAQLQVIFQAENEVDFTEISLRALEALGSEGDPTDLGLAWDARLSHILMDEFQDTNQTQYQLLQLLTAGWQEGDDRTFFAVGDPMQSVYLFREAEVGLFLQTRTHGLGDLQLSPLNLSVNFRSQRPLVDWVNQAFSRVLPADEDVVSGRVAYSLCTGHQPGDPDSRVHIHPFFGSDPRAEAHRVLEIIRSVRQQDASGSIAVLVRNRSHLRELLPILRRNGLVFQAVDIESLAQRPVIQDLLALTKALVFPLHRPAWLAVLRAPWCGLTLEDLFRLAGDDFEQPVLACLLDERKIAALSPLGRERISRVRGVMQRGVAGRGRKDLRGRVETAWLALGGAACVSDAKDLEDAEMFFDLLSERFSGLKPFEPSALDQALTDLFSAPGPRADPNLQIMTIHKAKGLEFDTIVLPGLGRIRPADPHQLLLWQERPRESGRSDLLLAPMAEAGEEQGKAYQYLKGLKKQKALHEEARVLYVAATRAVKRLHFLGHADLDRETNQPRPPAVNSPLACLWPAVQEVFQEESGQSAEPSGLGSVDRRDEDDPARLSRLIPGWSLPELGSDLALPRDSAEDSVSGLQPDPVEYVWVGPLLPKVGTLVHTWLHRLAEIGPKGWERLRIHSRSALYQRQLVNLGLNPSQAEQGAALVVRALEEVLADPRGSWILSEQSEARCEYGLTAWLEGRKQSVVLDRTFVDADGGRWIIDYKTSTHAGPDIESFLDREQQRYQRQMDEYAMIMSLWEERPIRLGLYFPLLRGWREWDFSSR